MADTKQMEKKEKPVTHDSAYYKSKEYNGQTI